MLGRHRTPAAVAAAAAAAAAAAGGGQLDAGRAHDGYCVRRHVRGSIGFDFTLEQPPSQPAPKKKNTAKRATSRLAADNNTYRQAGRTAPAAPSRAGPGRTGPGVDRLSLSARCRQRLLLTEHSTRSFVQPSIIHVHPPAVPPGLHSRYSPASISSWHTACY